MFSLYKILGFLLLPVGLLFGMISLFGVFMAFANPAILLSVFLTAASAIYIFLSFLFTQKGLSLNQPLSSRFKDWLKVNNYVALVFATLGVIQSFFILSRPEMQETFISQAISMQSSAEITEAQIRPIMKGLLIGMGILSAMLFVHALMTLQFIRRRADLFQDAQG